MPDPLAQARPTRATGVPDGRLAGRRDWERGRANIIRLLINVKKTINGTHGLAWQGSNKNLTTNNTN